MNRLYGVLAMLLICVVTCGCHAEEEGHHDEEHNEHFVPAHKPVNLEGAVNELRRRIPEVASGEDGNARQELFDIILWIPELAADSDLKKKDWERAADASLRLREVCEKTLSTGSSNADRQRAVELSQPLIDELAELLARVVDDPHRQPDEIN